MKILTNSEFLLMENLVGVSQESLHKILYKFLKQHYKKVQKTNDFLIAEGDIPIALVAHMDTVFPNPAKEVFYDRRKNVIWSPTGLGADDRAGIYAIIQIIKSGLRPHVIFTTDEEVGCVGATELSYWPCPFNDLRYLIQLDRRGSDDCVFYECNNPNFEKYIEDFGFVTAWGSFTDICELCPSWKIAGVNLSIGYRDEHTTSEILFVGQMLQTIEKVKKMLTQEDIPSFEFIPYYSSYSSYYDYDPDDYFDAMFYATHGLTPPSKSTVRFKCKKCGRGFPYDEVLQVKLIKGGTGYYCIDCISDGINWCENCKEAYEIDSKIPDNGLCRDCQKKEI